MKKRTKRISSGESRRARDNGNEIGNEIGKRICIARDKDNVYAYIIALSWELSIGNRIGKMYTEPRQMEPLLPDRRIAELEDLARDVVARSGALGGQLHPTTQRAVVELLRVTNSYYSNLIEGHSTHPVDIERAMRQDYSEDPAKRDLQVESLAHIDSQRDLDERLQAEPNTEITSPNFLRWLHRIFYERLPADLRWVQHARTGEVLEVVPGALREREVEVGHHVAPTAETLPDFLDRFASSYDPRKFHGVKPLIAIAASHHRLMWIHPFLDGNGRVARLLADAWFRKIPLLGYGLWNVSRGLARRREEYMTALTWADAPRRNDLDGQGNLSEEGLTKFSRFFLETCMDQIDFMAGLLQLDGLIERIRGYVKLRAANIIRGPEGSRLPLREEAAYMLEEVFLRGESARGDLVRISGLGLRTGRTVLSQLVHEGLLASETPKGKVHVVVPTHLGEYLFPNLYPAVATSS